MQIFFKVATVHIVTLTSKSDKNCENTSVDINFIYTFVKNVFNIRMLPGALFRLVNFKP